MQHKHLNGRSLSHLKEKLYLRALLQFCFAHPLVDFSWIAVNPCDKSVSVLLVGCAIVEVPHNDGLPASVPATKDQHDFTGFHNLTHFN